MLTVRYFAGAREAAGVASEQLDLGGPAPVATLRSALTTGRPGLAPVLAKCALLVAGTRATDDTIVPDGALVDVLPPFAGG